MKTWRIGTAIAAILGTCICLAPAIAAGQVGPYSGSNQQPLPGTLNYVEGVAYLDGRQLNQKEVGKLTMAAGQELRTSEGKVEILLNPGIYLRVDDDSAVKMVTPDLTPTVVDVEHGRAAVEVDQLLKGNVVQIVDNGVTTQLVKNGYYEFNANSPMARVFKGQAEVEYRPNKWEKVKGDRELAVLPGEHESARKFQPNMAEDNLMAWSKLRSQYLAEANNQIAPEYYGAAPGWYWDPWMWDYTFLGPGPFFSPFGWGFYPMGWYGGMGFAGWGGFYGHGFRPVGGGRFLGGNRGGGGGFHGGMAGGFHGGR